MNLETMAADVGPAILIRCALSSFVSSPCSACHHAAFQPCEIEIVVLHLWLQKTV